MSGRYTRLYALPENLHTDDAPILVVAGALLKDTRKDSVLAQLKLRNLNQLRLVACKVSISAFDPSGAELAGIDNYSYLDLAISCGEEFGSQKPIYLPDNTTRNISVSVIQAVFENGEVWQHSASVWKPVFQHRHRIADRFLDVELQKQYHLEVNGNCEYVPTRDGSLFFCTCGTINLTKNKTCYSCKRDAEGLMLALDEIKLTLKRDERLAQEETERLERERKEEQERVARERKEAEEREANERKAEEDRVAAAVKKKKVQRASIIVGTVVALAIAATFIITQFIIPNSKYKAAEQLLVSRDYDGAIDAFTALGDYRDSAARAMDVPYQRAEDMLTDGDYEGAIEIFRALGDYKDSADRIMKTQYQQAENILSGGNYEGAIVAFQALGDYTDAADRIMEIRQMQYDQADALLISGDYESAVDMFKALGDFSDSKDRILEATYLEAIDCFNSGDYDAALDGFRSIADYADSADYITKARYQRAKAFVSAGEYSSALSTLKDLGNYEDAPRLLLEAQDGIYQSAVTLFGEGDYIKATSVFRSINEYRDSEQQIQKIFETVYADAFNSFRSGQYSDAADKFNATSKEYPDIGNSTVIRDHITYCEVKSINFSDGDSHNLSSIYDKISSITDEQLKNELMNLPQMKTLMMLQGAWSGKYFRFTIQGGHYEYGIVDSVTSSLTIAYYDGRYCLGSGQTPTHYSEVYAISQNQFSYRDRQNNSYMNMDICTRIS